MRLSMYNYGRLGKDYTPSKELFRLPEKVLQFGTGALLRGLTDFFIDQANKAGYFNGRIVVVKSTNGNLEEFIQQDNLYTQCISGINKGKTVSDTTINASISRVLSAKDHWDAVLMCAANPDIEIIISNTTELGIVLMEEAIFKKPPDSFPAKLLAFLFERYKIFEGAEESGMVILPTELINENGKRLQEIVVQLSYINNLDKKFICWLTTHNHFCNTLVDRIVPGKPESTFHRVLESELGYEDRLIVISEPYALWAIETNSKTVRDKLSFAKADSRIIIDPDINLYRELKLRLLNGTHSFCCSIALLSGFDTVKRAMDSEDFFCFIQSLMKQEIIPAITESGINTEEANHFAEQVLDRFNNPCIAHYWLQISKQGTHKIAFRCIPILFAYFRRYREIPPRIALGIAAHLLFMKTVRASDGKYYSKSGSCHYVVEDDHASVFSEAWEDNRLNEFIKLVLSDSRLWGVDLTLIRELEKQIHELLKELIRMGPLSLIKKYQSR